MKTKRNDSHVPVALIYMPFGVTAPHIGISLLKAMLAQYGVACDLHYLNLKFAKEIGASVYDQFNKMIDPSMLIGEWFFTKALHGDSWDIQHPNIKNYQNDLGIKASQKDNKEALSWVEEVRAKAKDFIRTCFSTVDWQQYQVIGFSTMNQQTISSLALAQRIKTAYPDKIIVFGGANCAGEMGVELHRQFPFIDYVCQGESDYLFPALVQDLLAGRTPRSIPGLVSRSEDGDTISISQHAPIATDLDAMPYPDYDDFFQQHEESSLDLQVLQGIGIQTSRGCWYGDKQKCLFCSWNGEEVRFRSKSSKKVLDEMISLSRRYNINKFIALDSILNMQYLNDLLPDLIQRDLKLNLYFAIKSNLRKDQFRLLKQAGTYRVQPGIESLSTKILKLMRKGCTALQNIQTLKWTNEFGIVCRWNLLWGFPGEDEGEYARMAEMIPVLLHLQPPVAFGPVFLQRFNAYFEDPESFGLINLRPASIYQALYPFDEEILKNLAFYFEFDYLDGHDPSVYTAQLEEQLKYWQANHCPGALTAVSGEDTLTIHDQRPGVQQSRIEFQGIEKAIYEYCDTAHSLRAISKNLVELGYGIDQDDLRALMDNLVARRLMLSDGDWYISLAVFVGDLVEQVSKSQIIQQALAGVIYKLSDMYKEKNTSQ